MDRRPKSVYTLASFVHDVLIAFDLVETDVE
jgi:hypothetical protein